MSNLNTEKEIEEARQGEVYNETNPNISGRKFYLESYGCQMNFADSEIVASILSEQKFTPTPNYKDAELILINTCSIRENAEQRVRNRLKEFGAAKQKNKKLTIGILGCMAERLKSKFLEEEKIVDLVVGPDAYRDLPKLINDVDDGNKAINVLLSREETYADINPLRLNSNGVSAFISITRGCNNMCSFCVVPYTRGRERSRDAESIVGEAKQLFENGYREVTLLGQNVDSYLWKTDSSETTFAQLLEKVALISPLLRVRFSTSHPKDITDEVLHTIAKYDNICKYIHLPVQSGNSRILDLMNRTYDREWYVNKINTVRRIIPNCAISTDVITGFCSETEQEHQDTLSLMDYVKFNYAYMFAYSERPGTPAAKKFKDDISEDIKQRRLEEIIQKQQEHGHFRLKEKVGKTLKVLIDSTSRKSDLDFSGRSDDNSVVIFPVSTNYKIGDYVHVLVEKCTKASLIGKIIE